MSVGHPQGSNLRPENQDDLFEHQRAEDLDIETLEISHEYRDRLLLSAVELIAIQTNSSRETILDQLKEIEE